MDAVGEIWRAHELDELALGHLSGSVFPPADDLARAKDELKRLISVATAIELGAVFELTCVVDDHCVAALGEILPVAEH